MASFVLFCLGTYLDASPAADLEIRTYLHSGSSNPKDPLGVFVYGDPHSEAYIDVLRYENVYQNYRFLSELDVRHLEIAPAGTPFKLEKLVVSTEDVRNSVVDLKITLDELKKRHPSAKTLSLQQVVNKKMLIDSMQSEEKVNAVRHAREMTYLLKRYDAILRRISFPMYIAGYMNQQKKPTDEALTIYRTLCGRRGDDDDFVFGLDKLDLETLHDVQLSHSSVPWKLTAPQDKAGKVLDFLIFNKVQLGFSRVMEFRHSLDLLHAEYREKCFEYSRFNRESSTRLIVEQIDNADIHTLHDKIHAVQALRLLSFMHYKQWRVPFPSSGALFTIYLHDPEQRAYVWNKGRSHGSPFESKLEALEFLEKIVKPSFQRVPKSFYAGRLQTVLLTKGIIASMDATRSCARVRGDGYLMRIDDHQLPLASVESMVRRACGSVLYNKMRPTVRLKFTNIQLKYDKIRVAESTLPHKGLLLRMFNVFPAISRCRSCSLILQGVLLQKLWEIRKGINREKHKDEARNVRQFLEFERKVQTQISFSAVLSIRREIGDLVKKVQAFKRRYRRRDSAMLNVAEVPGFTSYSALLNVRKEFAELAQHIGNDAYRAALFVRSLSNNELREKVHAWFSVFTSIDAAGESATEQTERIDLAKKWQHELGSDVDAAVVERRAPITVVLISAPGSETFDFIEGSEKFIASRLRQGHDVSWVHVYVPTSKPAELCIKLVANRARFVPSELHFFGTLMESVDLRLWLKSLLEDHGFTAGGHPSLPGRQEFLPHEVTIHDQTGCTATLMFFE